MDEQQWEALRLRIAAGAAIVITILAVAAILYLRGDPT